MLYWFKFLEEMQESNGVESYINCMCQILIEECFRGKYITPDLTAWGRQGYCSMSQRPTSIKDEDVFPVGTHTEHTHISNIYTVGHTDHRHSEHSHEHRPVRPQHQWPHSVPFSGWTGWKPSSESRRTYMHTHICTQRAHTQEKIRKEFNRKIGWAVLIRYRTHQTNLLINNYLYVTGPFIPLYLCFPTFVPPQII